MLGAHADAGVDAGTSGVLQSVGAHVDVLFHRTGQAADHGTVPYLGSDLLHGLEVTRGADGEARLDHVHPQTQQLTGDHQLFLGVHGCAGGLLAIPEGSVENMDLAGHSILLRGFKQQRYQINRLKYRASRRVIFSLGPMQYKI